MRRNKMVSTVVGASGVVVLFIALLLFFSSRPPAEHGILRAWYAETGQGSALIIERSTHHPGTFAAEPTQATDPWTEHRLCSHRLSDGGLLGQREVSAASYPEGTSVKGAYEGRVWMVTDGEPLLVEADSLEPVADRAAIQQRLGQAFVLTHPQGSWNPYSGRFEVRAEDGKTYGVGVDLRATEQPSRWEPPEGYHCRKIAVEGLHSPTMALCLPPAHAPVVQLVQSRTSGLERGVTADVTELVLSGVEAPPAWGEPGAVRWSIPMASLVPEAEQATFVDAVAVGPDQALLLITTGKTTLHAITLGTLTGEAQGRRVLFADSLPCEAN